MDSADFAQSLVRNGVAQMVIVARGGGSIEDLWSFNEEVVVRAIAECSIPVISAVGHETDTTLADFAADRRAPTPTAAAEMAVPVRADLALTLADFAARQRRAVYRPVELGRERLAARARMLPRPENLLAPQAQRLDDLSERLRRALGDRSAKGRERLAGVAARLSPSLLSRTAAEAQRRLDRARLSPTLIERPLRQGSDRLAALTRVMSQLHPEKPLERGYAIIRDAGGNPFNDLTLPDALIKFRQGIGRLIRTQSDRGLFTILDSRVLAKSYGRNRVYSETMLSDPD